MAREGSSILDVGDPFPVLDGPTVAHGRVAVPEAWRGGWGVLLVHRAHW